VVRSLRDHRRRQLEERLAAGAAWRDTGYVFTTPIGTPIDPDNFSKAFKRIAERAGLGDWHLHELRHSCASLLLAEGVPLKVVSEYLGHTNISTTADIYGHVAPPQFEAAAAAIDAAIWDVPGDDGASSTKHDSK
jgi:integrase